MSQVPVARAVGVPSGAFVSWMRQRVSAAGLDPGLIPDEPARFLRISEVVKRSGLSRASLYRLMERGEFPRAVALSEPLEAACS